LDGIYKTKVECFISKHSTQSYHRRILFTDFSSYPRYSPSERLFFVNKHAILRKLNNISKLSGVKKIRIHDLRHSHASLLIELGFPPLLISERLGHENVETTLNIYSHLYPNKHEEVAKALSQLMQMKK